MRGAPADESSLLGAAREAALRSHSPYSKFPVGAAAVMDGEVFLGTNIENASYGLTVCAERVAIFQGAAAGRRRLTALALSCTQVPPGSPPHLSMPCGACRQVMLEFGDGNTRVFVDQVGEFALAALLPLGFVL